jgi:hypothetical protein
MNRETRKMLSLILVQTTIYLGSILGHLGILLGVTL